MSNHSADEPCNHGNCYDCGEVVCACLCDLTQIEGNHK